MQRKVVGFIVCTLLITATGISVVGTDENRERFNKNYTTSTLEQSPPLNGLFEWPMFQHDLNRSGYSTSNGPITNNVLWARQLDDRILTSPTVVDNKVYVTGREIQNSVYCLNADTGDEIWKTYISDSPSTSPTVADGKIFVGTHGENFYALDANTGSIIWVYSTGNSYSSPLVTDGKVYIGTKDGAMYCLNTENGQKIWNLQFDSHVKSPAFSNGKIYTTSGSYAEMYYVYCLNASNGNIIWTYQGDYGFFSPVIYDEKIYVGNSVGYFHCLNSINGDLIWRTKINGYISTTACIAEGKAFLAERHFYLYCYNTSYGYKIWEFETDTGHAIYCPPTYADGMVYFGYDFGCIYCINGSSGELIWKYETTEDIHEAFAIADGKVYISTWYGMFFCLGGESSNHPPITPEVIEGPTTGYPGEVYTYNTSTFDIDGDQIYYKWDSDYEYTDWMGPYNSNETVSVSFTWDYTGTYEISVIARDTNYATSEWAHLEVTMPVNQHSYSFPLLQRLLERFPNAFPILRNIFGL